MVQVKGENGGTVITPDGNVMYNIVVHPASAAQQAGEITGRNAKRAAVD